MIETREHLKRKVDALGKQMAYVEMGEGNPIVFLHGNPTSSYLWRNIMPQVQDLGRCIAPDLIGMGDSDKLDQSGPDSYTFQEHRRYLDAVLEALGVTDNVTLVIHDWGSALGFDWANRHRSAVKGICYMEALVRPLVWEDIVADSRETFRQFRSPAGDEMVLKNNIFVDAVLPGFVMRGLEEAELEVYRRPYLEAGENRRPMLTWPRQIPIAGEPADTVEVVQAYADWLSTDPSVPKLFVNADPGALTAGAARDFCRTWPNQNEVTVKGTHFIQEDSPDEIGAALRAWLTRD
ncbi:MAG TPA: haloalkane dehalogenase [Sneathiellales bacterium]|nr:haloalkane dehalogenase [Sneathiellales bacterium]